MKIYIVTPAYDGRVHRQYAVSLAVTTNALIQNGHQVILDVDSINTLLVAARNNFLRKFIDETDCTHIMMIDSDLGWNPMEFLEFIKSDKDILGSIYPSRKYGNFFYNPDYNEDGSYKTDGFLLKCNHIPSGFVLMKREAVEKMMKDYAHLAYEPKIGIGEKGHMLFNTEVHDGEFWSEDCAFFRKAKDSGLECWIDPRLTFDHAGVVGGAYMVKDIGDYLEKKCGIVFKTNDVNQEKKDDKVPELTQNKLEVNI